MMNLKRRRKFITARGDTIELLLKNIGKINLKKVKF
jgi:hypothetical protein